MTSNWAVASSEVFLRMIGAVVEISEVKWKSTCCVQLWDPHTPPGSSVHGILQAETLQWAAMSISRESSQPRDRTRSPALQTDSLPSEPPGNLVGATPFQIVPYGGRDWLVRRKQRSWNVCGKWGCFLTELGRVPSVSEREVTRSPSFSCLGVTDSSAFYSALQCSLPSKVQAHEVGVLTF